MSLQSNLKKLSGGVESALSLVQSDFGLFSTYYFEKLDNGEVDPIDLYISFKKVEKFIETVLPYIKDFIDETKLNIAYKKHHVSLQTQAGKPFYDFKNCNGIVWRDLNLTKQETDEAVKERESFLKKISKKTEIS